jgi:molecular chaperone GrpE (heat shock protein)
MKDRKRHHRDSTEADDAPEPPTPEAQGDGEPAPAETSASAQEPREAPPVDQRQNESSDQLSQQLDKYLRLAAEYDNYRKRSMKA